MTNRNKINITLVPVGFASALTLVFVIAKIWGYIDWSWFLVFLPITWWLWVVAAILAVTVTVAIVVGILFIIGFIIGALADKLHDYNSVRRFNRKQKKNNL